MQSERDTGRGLSFLVFAAESMSIPLEIRCGVCRRVACCSSNVQIEECRQLVGDVELKRSRSSFEMHHRLSRHARFSFQRFDR